MEGDTDEVFFKEMLEYYKKVSHKELVPCDVCNLKGVTRYTSKLLAKLKNDILPEAKSKNIAIQTVCCSYDTDVFEVRNPLIVNWDSIRKSIKRMGVERFIQIGVCSAIEDWILDDLEGICNYLKLKQVPKYLKGENGNAKLCDLYTKARRTYSKGYATREMIKVLDFAKIRAKRIAVLKDLEQALNFTIQ
ncbi:MAG: hypothetical protein Q4C30_00970 [Bacteroidia bacterium]|nr:hypothetical protein [Bacteroidia bacterium]